MHKKTISTCGNRNPAQHTRSVGGGPRKPELLALATMAYILKNTGSGEVSSMNDAQYFENKAKNGGSEDASIEIHFQR